MHKPVATLRTLSTSVLSVALLLLAACTAHTAQSLPPTIAQQSAARTAQSALAVPIGARAIPIGARAIPIGARAIPIGARAIPINFTSLPLLGAVCGVLGSGSNCTAIRRLDILPALDLLAGNIPGYQPDDLASAYNVPSSGGSGSAIGIVVAYDNPHADADLAVYRSTFGLPACRVASGCLQFAAGNGSASLPRADENWGQELSIDLDMASAICPNCKLLVVEAQSADIDDLTNAMKRAVALGATVVSNSYTTPETPAVAAQNASWHQPVPIVAGAGDNGYGVGWPAASSNVTAVGGTTLLPVLDGFAWLELAWSKSGSGCSNYITKPSWQHDLFCRHRTVADVSAIADPTPGVAVYDTYFANASDAGWNVYGGTSVSTPIVAALYAVTSDNPGTSDASRLYARSGGFTDIILGSNALCLTYLCTAGLGYDGPSGLGTPKGSSAF